MKEALFAAERMAAGNARWFDAVRRQQAIYGRRDDIRSEFARDYNRILHSMAYRRLKHKTQVFFATENDHICTRIEHVNHVASVSYTICKFMGLNTELSNAIAIGHDLGHAPFGHAGEDLLNDIMQQELGRSFWHERNSLRFVDDFETLQDPYGKECNLDLTYAVRDGILLHCGEIDEQAVFPRQERIALETVTARHRYQPFTWEGCIVKIADKIAYLGRDIEDAFALKVLDRSQLRELRHILQDTAGVKLRAINTTTLMHDLIIDLCAGSSPARGLNFSAKYFDTIKCLKKFSMDNIYEHPRLKSYREHAGIVMKSIFEALQSQADMGHIRYCVSRKRFDPYPLLLANFYEWLVKYGNIHVPGHSRSNTYKNRRIYDLTRTADYKQATIDFMSGMTDNFALKAFEELTRF